MKFIKERHIPPKFRAKLRSKKGFIPPKVRFFRSQGGEIATILTLAVLAVIGISTFASSFFLKNKATTKTMAGGGDCPGKLNIVGACDPACCNNDTQCNGPGETCTVPNGYCVSGTSCAAPAPTTPQNPNPQVKYVRMCGGASCGWTFCDGVNVPLSQCCDTPDTSDPKCNLCTTNEQCQTQVPTPYPNVTSCKDSAGHTNSCPATYPQCYGAGKSVSVHRDCTQSNSSGCVYWCEGKTTPRVTCDSPDAKTYADSSCGGPALPTVTPTTKTPTNTDCENKGYQCVEKYGNPENTCINAVDDTSKPQHYSCGDVNKVCCTPGAGSTAKCQSPNQCVNNYSCTYPNTDLGPKDCGLAYTCCSIATPTSGGCTCINNSYKGTGCTTDKIGEPCSAETGCTCINGLYQGTSCTSNMRGEHCSVTTGGSTSPSTGGPNVLQKKTVILEMNWLTIMLDRIFIDNSKVCDVNISSGEREECRTASVTQTGPNTLSVTYEVNPGKKEVVCMRTHINPFDINNPTSKEDCVPIN